MNKNINQALSAVLHTVKSYGSSPKGDGKRRAGKALANGAS